jgi:hypothetical protein
VHTVDTIYAVILMRIYDIPQSKDVHCKVSR